MTIFIKLFGRALLALKFSKAKEEKKWYKDHWKITDKDSLPFIIPVGIVVLSLPDATTLMFIFWMFNISVCWLKGGTK